MGLEGRGDVGSDGAGVEAAQFDERAHAGPYGGDVSGDGGHVIAQGGAGCGEGG